MSTIGTRVLAVRVKEKVHERVYTIAKRYDTTPARVLNALFLEDSDKTGAATEIAVAYLEKLYGDSDVDDN